MTYEQEITALLVVDPYNEFISDGGRLWGRLRAVAEANDINIPNYASAVVTTAEIVESISRARGR